MVVNLNYSQCVDEKSTVTCIDCIQRKISTCAVGECKKEINYGVASAFIVVGCGDSSFIYYQACK